MISLSENYLKNYRSLHWKDIFCFLIGLLWNPTHGFIKYYGTLITAWSDSPFQKITKKNGYLIDEDEVEADDVKYK